MALHNTGCEDKSAFFCSMDNNQLLLGLVAKSPEC